MAYILRAPETHTLMHNGKAYQDGDRIVISKREAEQIAGSHKFYRFDETTGDGEISPDSVNPPAVDPVARTAPRAPTPTP